MIGTVIKQINNIKITKESDKKGRVTYRGYAPDGTLLCEGSQYIPIANRAKKTTRFLKDTGVHIALCERPLDRGLDKSSIIALLGVLNATEVIPMEIQGEYSSAMGFIDIKTAEKLSYNYTKIEEEIKAIMNNVELENPQHTYVFGKIRVFLTKN